MAAAVTADWKPLLPKLNFTGDAKQIAPFLDGVTSAKAMQVCKLWQAKLREPRDAMLEDRICIQEGFPEEIVKAFRARKLSLWRLPVIDTANIPQRDYIDLSEDLMPAGASLARFKDFYGRVGFGVQVQGNIDGNFTFMDETIKIRDFKKVACVFRRYTNSGQWVKDCRNGDIVLRIYDELHEPHHTGRYMSTCPTCPTFQTAHSQGCKEFIIRMVSGTDTVFKLASEVQQVADVPPLPALKPKPKPEPKEEPMTLCSCLAAIAEWIVSSVLSLLGRLGL